MSRQAQPGRTAVVTGAANGIGLAIAKRFVADGLRVALADWDQAALDEAVRGLRSQGADVMGFRTDVRDPESVGALANAVSSRFGDVHVLCNNAGVITPGRAWETPPDEWSRVLGVNVDGVINGLRAFVPAMLGHGKPSHIVNTASAAGLFAAPSFSAYCVSKAAVIALSESLAAEIALIPGAQVSVHVLCPGSTTSNLFRAEVSRRATSDLATSTDPQTARRWAETAAPERGDQVDPEVIVDALWAAMDSGALYVFPIQADMRDLGRARLAAVGDALAQAVPVDGEQTGPASPMLDYFARLDGPVAETALDLLADDLEFRFSRPDGSIEGGRADLASYIGTRRGLAHRVDRHAVDGSFEFGLGQSLDGHDELGAFVAAMQINGEGRITRYLASFFPGQSFDAAI